MKEFDYIVFVGRFQPFHEGHKSITDEAFKRAEKLIIVAGSYRVTADAKNPWTFEERKEMILKALGKDKRKRVIVLPVRDYMYSDLTWITSLRNTVDKIVEPNAKVGMIGHFKDDSSYYLNFFPQWPLLARPNYMRINGTDIRDDFFNERNFLFPRVCTEIACHMRAWKEKNQDKFEEIVSELKFLVKYKSEWSRTPYPVNFVTTDAVVVQAGHVLMVTRGVNPGKGKLALPGGFINIDERIFDSCIRELYEETKIDISKKVLKKNLTEVKVFDHPKRSGRGRIITHAHFFNLEEGGPLPRVHGGDDAFEAHWIPLGDLRVQEENIFSDHIHIIHHFTRV